MVMGTPRSGTSLVAGVLHTFGIRMARQLADSSWEFSGGANQFNAKGFFEDDLISGYLWNMFDSKLPDAPFRLQQKDRHVLHNAIIKRQRDAVSHGCDWGVKSSILPFILEDFRELCTDNIRIVMTVRDSASSIQSWQAMMGCTDTEATRVVNSCQAAMNTVTSSSGLDIFTVQIADLVQTPTDTVRSIAAFVGLPSNPAAESFPDASLLRY